MQTPHVHQLKGDLSTTIFPFFLPKLRKSVKILELQRRESEFSACTEYAAGSDPVLYTSQ